MVRETMVREILRYVISLTAIQERNTQGVEIPREMQREISREMPRETEIPKKTEKEEIPREREIPTMPTDVVGAAPRIVSPRQKDLHARTPRLSRAKNRST